jgi:hypothetical protein
MVATPLEQDVVEEAEKFTGPDTVAPLAGEVTITPAKAAGAQIAIEQTISNKDFGM